ncbi:MAG TPA: hypothetical protein VNA25_23140 [Phycisphaerae bacterium]|nr:hypothetical protein [Phycisphaerae bacterium]
MMRNCIAVCFALVFLAFGIVGCGTGDTVPQQTSRQSSQPDGGQIRGVERLGSGIIIAIPGRRLDGDSNLSPPDAADRAFAEELDAEITEAGIVYMKIQYPYLKDRRLSLTAARQVGEFMLLCYDTMAKDGDMHLVYAMKTRKILGRFCWYVQG